MRQVAQLGQHYPGAAGLRILRGAELREVRAGASVVSTAFLPLGIEQTFVPFVIPTAIASRLSLHADVPHLRDGRGSRPQGTLVPAGCHLSCLPYLQHRVSSYRHLPIGIFSLDAAWVGARDRCEDLLCVNGVYVTATLDREIEHAIDALLSQVIPSLTRDSEPPILAGGRRIIWTVDSHVLAAVETVQQELNDFAVTFQDSRGSHHDAVHHFFYVSEMALGLFGRDA